MKTTMDWQFIDGEWRCVTLPIPLWYRLMHRATDFMWLAVHAERFYLLSVRVRCWLYFKRFGVLAPGVLFRQQCEQGLFPISK